MVEIEAKLTRIKLFRAISLKKFIQFQKIYSVWEFDKVSMKTTSVIDRTEEKHQFQSIKFFRIQYILYEFIVNVHVDWVNSWKF